MLPYSAFNKKKVLAAGAPRRVYGLVGDAFLQKRVLDSLLEWSLPPESRDFNMDSVDGESSDVNDIFALCGNLPFLADHRVIVVSRAERIENMHRSSESSGAASAAKTKKTSASKRLGEGLKNFPATTILILQRSPETPEAGARGVVRCVNAAVDKVIESDGVGGIIVDCTVGARDARTPTAVVQNEADLRGIPLSRDAAMHLVTRCGHDIENLLNELEKCALRAGIGNLVTPPIIDEMTKKKLQETIFDLTDALGQKNTAHAVGLLRELLENGEPAPQILAMLVRHLRQLLQARTFIDAGLSLHAGLAQSMPPDLAAQLPASNLANWLQVNGRMGPRLAAQANNFSIGQLQSAMRGALSADLAMKGIEGDGGAESKKEPDLLLELFVAGLG